MNTEKVEDAHEMKLEVVHNRRKMRQESAMNRVVCEEVHYMGRLSWRATEYNGGEVVMMAD